MSGTCTHGSWPITSSISDLLFRTYGLIIETIPDIREDSMEELGENDLPRRERYEWVLSVVIG